MAFCRFFDDPRCLAAGPLQLRQSDHHRGPSRAVANMPVALATDGGVGPWVQELAGWDVFWKPT